MGENQAVHHWRKGDARRQCARYPAVYQWGILDSSHWSALAGFAGNVWKLEECTPLVLRWRDKGIWERILEALVDDTDFEWLMIDASHVKVHPDAAGARGGNQAMGRTKGGSHQDTSGRGCAWCAGGILYHFWYHSGLHNCSAADGGLSSKIPSGRSGL